MVLNKVLLYAGFNLFVIAMLALDLGVFHRRAHAIKIKEALLWSAFWIILALLFNLGIYLWMGHESALEFLTGYLLEKSLSMDNLFVFLIIFSYFHVPASCQHKVLFWGILGALITRGIFIFAGVSLIHKFHWLIYIFGIFLVFTGVKMFFQKDKKASPEKNIAIRFFRKLMPVLYEYEGDKFFIKKNKVYFATPLLIVLLVIETTDIVFAVDSIPAIFGITLDPFIVYTSNVFAILGLRALYFALAGIMEMFHYLHYGLSVILVFIGVKMLIAGIYEIPVVIALAAVAVILFISVAASIAHPQKKVKE